MFVCMYVCLYVCLYVFTYVCTYTSIISYFYINSYVFLYFYIRMYVEFFCSHIHTSSHFSYSLNLELPPLFQQSTKNTRIANIYSWTLDRRPRKFRDQIQNPRPCTRIPVRTGPVQKTLRFPFGD